MGTISVFVSMNVEKELIMRKLTKCSFCSYATQTGCMVTPNSYYCKKANDEYYAYIRGTTRQTPVKSLRPWQRNTN
jgi:hypothetical protein